MLINRLALTVWMLTLLGLMAFGFADEVAAPRLQPLPREAPAPQENPTTAEKVSLGKQLFFGPRLSGDNALSCASCHIPEKGWGDGVPLGQGHQGKKLSRHTQSVLDVAFYTTYFWDGRARSLEEQAPGPIVSPDEMNQDLAALEEELNAIPGYVSQFQKVFGTRVTRTGIAQALAAFQRTLISGESPFDRYLRGETDALSEQAKRGLQLFTGDARCIECHHGPLLSDGKYYRLGVSFRDEGRFAVTQEPADQYRFRTPSLRNVARTSPYMHDGSLKTLTDVVTFYYRGIPTTGPQGLELDAEPLVGQSFSEIPALVAFLESLSSDLPRITPPELP